MRAGSDEKAITGLKICCLSTLSSDYLFRVGLSPLKVKVKQGVNTVEYAPTIRISVRFVI